MVLDETEPLMTIDGVSHPEGNAGTTTFSFTVKRSGDTSGTATVNWATVDGTATEASGDYVAATGTLTFNPGISTQTIAVAVKGDTIFEKDEVFSVRLSNPFGVVIGTAVAGGMILDDDTPPTKFYVVDAPSNVQGRTYEYSVTGQLAEDYAAFGYGVGEARGVATTVAGTLVWAVDASHRVLVFDTNGKLYNAWGAGSMPSNAQPEGITVNGNDVWIVDRTSKKVYRYANSASPYYGGGNATRAASDRKRRSDSQNWPFIRGSEMMRRHLSLQHSVGRVLSSQSN